ncbi:MAG TPA: thioesterase family protein [Anaerolineales bacterium]
MSELTPGLNAEISISVSEEDTASRWGSGLVPVYSTPALVGLVEAAAVRVLEGRLEAGQTSVGGHIDIRHLAATPVGMNVRARAELIARDGRRLTFKVEAWDELEKIGEGLHERFVIDTEKFVSRARAKQKSA